MTDPIADMIIRIKNAFMADHREVVLPHSKVKKAIADILLENKYIASVEVIDKKPQPDIKIKLRFIGKLSVITNVKRLSKPGRRSYSTADKIPNTLNGYGITIVSTSKGLMTDKHARQQNLGGELICQVW